MFTARPYQQQMLAAGLGELRKHRSTLLISPTGTGKTVTFLMFAKLGLDHGRRILVLVHRDNLVGQTAKQFANKIGVMPGIEQGRKRAYHGAQVVVASVQTLSRDSRLGAYAPDAFNLIIVDETHHVTSASWRKIIDHFASAKILGVTATPDRADSRKLTEVFESVAWRYTLKDAIQDGWLVPIRQKIVKVEGLDFSTIGKANRDMTDGEVAALLQVADLLEGMIHPTISLVGDRPTVVFTPSVTTAETVVQLLRNAGRTADVIHQKTKSEERKLVFERYERGESQFLVNVGVLTEGWDAPQTSAVVMMRMTRSRALYTQMVGRGTRVLPGIVDADHLRDAPAEARRAAIAASAKPDVLVVDFVGAGLEHSLVHAASCLEPDADAKVVARAEALVLEQPELPLLEALDIARQLLDATEDRIPEARMFTVEEIDPFTGTKTAKAMAMLGVKLDKRRATAPKPSPNQQIALANFGVPEPAALSRREASELLDTLVERAEGSRATLRQVELLRRYNLPVERLLELSLADASQLIAELEANQWRRPPHWPTAA